ncbi:MAG: diguanylate cyclase domain-containing protein [Noviherbaspirillum sp.]
MSQRTVRSGGPLKSPPRNLLASALESVSNAILITDDSGHIVWANQAFCRLSGYALDEVFGNTPVLLKAGMQSESFYAELWATVLAGNMWRGVMVERCKDGSLYTVDETITPLRDDMGAITHFIVIQQDVTPGKQENERNRYLAYHDVLTGLPNRVFFLDLQRQAMHHVCGTPRSVALLFLDLDGFKLVNDCFGHAIGDQLLQAVAERLSAAVRKSDTVARFGGDEFAILVPALLDLDIALTLASKLVATMAHPFMIDWHRIHIGASIGISLYPADGEDQDELICKADQAMYQAKKRGGGDFQFYGNAFS